MTAALKSKRKSIRFKPDLGSIALLDFAVEGDFEPSVTGLICNESYAGCALVFAADIFKLKAGHTIRVQPGAIGPMPAEVVWVKRLDEELVKVGLKYLEP